MYLSHETKQLVKPADVKYELHDMICAIWGFEDFIGKEIKIIINPTLNSTGNVEYMGADDYKSLCFWLAATSFNGLPHSLFLEALVLNPKDLPFEVSTDYDIYVITSDVRLHRAINIGSAARYIEKSVERNTLLDIDDFVILAGKYLTDKFINLVIRATLKYKKSLKEEWNN